MMSQYPRFSGFTLIELLIVVAVVAILAAVALPSYRDQVGKGRRVDAMTSLENVQLAEAGWRANHTTYTTDLTSLRLSATLPEGYYTIAIGSADATTFAATAVPVADGPQASDSCGTFAIDEGGPDHSGDYADASCWRR